jgi:hypothetical protein
MSEHDVHPRNAVYECMDVTPESTPGGYSNVIGSAFCFVRSTCDNVPCLPYVNNRVITCVVCTK